jgi:hypothetical protein
MAARRPLDPALKLDKKETNAMVKVLVATTEGQGRRHDDYAWAVDGELVYIPNRQCECPGCGCERGFAGMASNRSTTTALVVDRPDLTVAEVRGAFVDSVERQDRTPHRSTGLDPRGLHELFGRLLASVAHFQVGSIIEREGDLLRRRALAEPIPSPFGPPGDGRP